MSGKSIGVEHLTTVYALKKALVYVSQNLDGKHLRWEAKCWEAFDLSARPAPVFPG